VPAERQPERSGADIAACIAAACLIAAPLATNWEGLVPRARPDPANIPTVCFGETENVDPSRIYSKSECAVLLRQRMARDYAPRIAACLPEIVPNRFIFGALIDASYNAGWAAVCRSPMARLIKAGQLRQACNALPSWYVTAQRRVNGKRVGKPFLLKGLVNRRTDERAVCLKGAA
jgi:lysozyme